MSDSNAPKPKSQRFTFLLDAALREKLTAEAKRRDLNIGQLIRRALNEFFAKDSGAERG
jgi:predicted HicB family RNase H-like nuclease